MTTINIDLAAVEQALEALSLALSDVEWRINSPTQRVIHKGYNALRAALAQQDEPAQDSGYWGRVAARQASRIKQLETAVQQALEVLKFCTPKPRPTDDDYAEQGWKEHNAAIASIRAAMVQE